MKHGTNFLVRWVLLTIKVILVTTVCDAGGRILKLCCWFFRYSKSITKILSPNIGIACMWTVIPKNVSKDEIAVQSLHIHRRQMGVAQISGRHGYFFNDYRESVYREITNGPGNTLKITFFICSYSIKCRHSRANESWLISSASFLE